MRAASSLAVWMAVRISSPRASEAANVPTKASPAPCVLAVIIKDGDAHAGRGCVDSRPRRAKTTDGHYSPPIGIPRNHETYRDASRRTLERGVAAGGAIAIASLGHGARSRWGEVSR